MIDTWTEEQETILGAQQGDASALERILNTYHPMLTVLAQRLGVPSTLWDELVQAGYVGLMQAVYKFCPAHGTRLSTYAVPWILGEMKRALRKALDDTGALQKHRYLMRYEAQLYQSLGRAPRVDELAQASGLQAQQIAQIEACASGPLSLESPQEEHATTLAQALAGGEEIDVDSIGLRLAIESLKKEEQQLIYLRYFREQTQQETARLLGKSQAQISRMERHALDQLRELLS